MSTLPFESFINLVRFDQSARALKQNIQQEQVSLQKMHGEAELMLRELIELKGQAHVLQKEVDAKELEMKDFESRERELKSRLDHVSNQKEYSATKHELDMLQASQHAAEDELVALWNKLETARRVVEQKDREMDEKVRAIREDIEAKEKDLAIKQKELGLLLATRSEKMDAIPEEWVEKYESMRERVDDPVVEIMHGGCGGCFYAVPNQDLTRLKRRALLQCNSCYRFIYDPKSMQSES